MSGELRSADACGVRAGTEGVDAELLSGGRGGEAGVAGGRAGVHGAGQTEMPWEAAWEKRESQDFVSA